ncbi:MAG: ABC transporter permease [Chloroflexota bacterium]|nr:ABC transporter permease [Chloroflexota bacterium]
MAAIAQAKTQPITLSRQRLLGAFYTLVGLAMLYLFTGDTKPDQLATLGMNTIRSVQLVKLPDIIVPVQPVVWTLGALVVILGLWQLARGFRRTGLLMGPVSFLFLVSFLVWAARGTSFSLIGILSASIQLATPILLGALSGILCERAGVVNIAIEGIMLSAAFTSVLFANVTGNIMIGLLAALGIGAILAAWHAVLSIQFKVNQIISGTVINIFATGFTNFLNQRIFYVTTDLNTQVTFPTMSQLVPDLGKIPILGPLLFDQGPIVWTSLILLVVIQVALFNTRWGLRTRAVGEHPRAADTLGIDVFRTRYINVILGGIVAGLGGAYFTLGSVGRFDKLMTNGRGFIALAAMIFGNWMPTGAFASSLLFGFADALQVKLQILINQVNIPSEFLLMLPYIVTMVALAGVVGRVTPPAADGEAYEKQ